MNNCWLSRRTFLGFALTLSSFSVSAETAKDASKKKAHVLLGVVDSVDRDGYALTVNHEAVPGWMNAMTMRYNVAADVVNRVQPGDKIKATVYDGDYNTLHEIQVVGFKNNESPRK
jgi:protein SCO1/2